MELLYGGFYFRVLNLNDSCLYSTNCQFLEFVIYGNSPVTVSTFQHVKFTHGSSIFENNLVKYLFTANKVNLTEN